MWHVRSDTLQVGRGEQFYLKIASMHGMLMRRKANSLRHPLQSDVINDQALEIALVNSEEAGVRL